MALTTVHLMRHGEVDNPEGVLYERLDGFGLTERGREMTALTARWLATENRDIAMIMSSPLQRAQESAAPAAEIFQLPIFTDSRLTEAGNKLRGQKIHRSPLTLASPRYWPLYGAPWLPSWGEHYRDIAQRMFRAVAHARALTPPGRESLVVSHQLPIWTLRRFVEGKSLVHDPRKRECALASVTSFYFDNATLIGLDYASPAESLVAQSQDVTPGSSSAAVNTGR